MKHLWRGWIPSEKKMVGPFDTLMKVPLTENGTVKFNIYVTLNKGKFYDLYTDSDHDFVFMRCTEMKDIHGERICENDIIRCTINGIIAKVEYNFHNHRFYVAGDKGRSLLSNMAGNIEVIGNIYEMKDLLFNKPSSG